jgi:high-affinity iron transporter
MLIVTGVLLAVVLVVRVGEEVQEMQLAGWLPTTHVDIAMPDWIGLWFAVLPTVEGLGQALALALCPQRRQRRALSEPPPASAR